MPTHPPYHGYGVENEPHEDPWTPGVGDKVKIACDWTLRQGQIGIVLEINRDEDGEIAGASLIIQHEDGSQDEYGFEDLIHPDEELFPEDDYCQDCGAPISFEDETAYVTASGDVYCRDCGRRADEEQERVDDEEARMMGWWDYPGEYDLLEDEETGVYIGPENDTMGERDDYADDFEEDEE